MEININDNSSKEKISDPGKEGTKILKRNPLSDKKKQRTKHLLDSEKAQPKIKLPKQNHQELKNKSNKKKKKRLFSRRQNADTSPIVNRQKQAKRKTFWKYVKAFLLSIILTALIGGGIWGYKNFTRLTEKIGVNVSVGDVVDVVIQPEEVYELKTDDSGKFTNILAVGIDTRENNKSLQNTDTIMIASYNHETDEIVMFSIPRDTYVEFAWLGRRFNKINSVYNGAEQNEEGTGLETLKGVVEDYLGIQIQYYGMVDYQGFKSAVDTVGGLTIDVENTFTDYQFPTDPGSPTAYKTIHFDAGIQTMDAETALIYARSRHSMNNGEGSDFARAARQQKVVQAIKDELLSSDTWLSPEKILGLISSLEDNIKMSEIDIKDIKAGLALAEDLKSATVYSFVFDPSIGNWQVIYEDRATYAIMPKLGVGNYQDTHTLTQDILNNPKLYQEKALVRVYDAGLGYYPTLTKVQELQTEYPFLQIVYGGTKYYDKEGVYVYVNSEDGDVTATRDEFANYYELTDEIYQSKPEFITNYFGNQDVTILIGKEIVVEDTALETPLSNETDSNSAETTTSTN